MWLPAKYAIAVIRHWGGIVTSGFIIGLLWLWQGTGHFVPPWVYWSVAGVGLAVATFKAWLEEHQQLEDLSTTSLSEAARELLIEASKDKDGIILRTDDLNGSQIQTNKRQFVTERGHREEAKWQAAVEELDELGLIEGRGFEQAIFQVTDEGYRVADLLSKG